MEQDVYLSEVIDFLATNSIGWQPAFLENTPFFCVRLEPSDVVLHLVSLQLVRQHQLDASFFKKISASASSQKLRVIHLWEDVWRSHQELVKARLLALAGHSAKIHARLCEVKRIDRLTADKFLETNHLQVLTTSKFKYGLFIKSAYQARYNTPTLVAVATFSGGRNFIKEQQTHRSYELIRFANLMGCTVVGGLDKLLQAFIREHHPNDVMTYADRDWSDGRSYEKLGFRYEEALPPQVFFLDPTTLTRHYPHRLQHVPEGWLEIHNAGSLKYRLTL
ncbi:MAG: hypothetical protein U0Y10_12830 [Spirosomataceae bacterium]|mgnify:CR=1 FL=1